MKATLASLTLTLTTVVATAAPEDYVNFVRQIQEDTGVEWDVSVAPNGTMLSPEGVGEVGALFELWSVHSFSGLDYILDEEFVSSFTPEVTISIETLDPYDVIPRTRVDQPFSVNIAVSGLLTGPDAPIEARQVLMTHEASAYPEGLHGFPENVERVGVVAGSSYLDGNGDEVMNFSVSSIVGEDLTRIEGEEEFTAYAISETGAGEEILDSAVVQVWPIALATITGLTGGESYDVLPTVQIVLTDLYPDSETYLRIYKNLPGAEGDPIEVSDSYVIIEDIVPQDRVVTLSDLDAMLPDEGTYTFEIIHTTPFGTELLDQVHPVVIDRTLEIRGTLFAKE